MATILGDTARFSNRTATPEKEKVLTRTALKGSLSDLTMRIVKDSPACSFNYLFLADFDFLGNNYETNPLHVLHLPDTPLLPFGWCIWSPCGGHACVSCLACLHVYIAYAVQNHAQGVRYLYEVGTFHS